MNRLVGQWVGVESVVVKTGLVGGADGRVGLRRTGWACCVEKDGRDLERLVS